MNHNETLIKIEDLMLDICSRKYRLKKDQFKLASYRKAAIDIYEPALEYSPMLQGYFDLMSISHPSDLNRILKPNLSFPLSTKEFVEVRDVLINRHDDFIDKHKRQRKRNAIALTNDFDALRSKHSKLLLVRVDVCYRKDVNIGIRQFDADLKVLRRRIQNRDTCFKGVLDYSWAIEQGRERGYHCHFLLIYNGSKHMCDGYYAEQLVEMWLDLTRGDGCYFSCNSKNYKDSYLRKGTLGIGMIHRSDERAVENAVNTILYLARDYKEDQHLRAKIPGMRGFG